MDHHRSARHSILSGEKNKNYSGQSSNLFKKKKDTFIDFYRYPLLRPVVTTKTRHFLHRYSSHDLMTKNTLTKANKYEAKKLIRGRDRERDDVFMTRSVQLVFFFFFLPEQLLNFTLKCKFIRNQSGFINSAGLEPHRRRNASGTERTEHQTQQFQTDSPDVLKVESGWQLEVQLDCGALMLSADRVFNQDVNL